MPQIRRAAALAVLRSGEEQDGPTIKLSVAALGGDGIYETEADADIADITLPKSVQAVPDKYKGRDKEGGEHSGNRS